MRKLMSTRPMLGLSIAMSWAFTTVAMPAQANTTQANTTTVSASSASASSANKATIHSDGILAMVNDSVILKSDFERALQAERLALQANGEQLISDSQLQTQTLDGLIIKQLQLDYAKRLGLTLNADAVNAELNDIAKSQNFHSLTQLQQHMDSQMAGSYAQLRQQIAEKQIIQALQQRQLYGELSINEQDIQAFLQSPESNLLTPKEYETLHFRVPYLSDINNLSANEQQHAMNVADTLVQALQNNDVRTQPQINQLLSSLATQYPQPIEGGNMGYHLADNLPAALADRITSLQIGEVTPPLITQHGLDIIKLIDVRQSQNEQTNIIPQWHTQHILIKNQDQQTEPFAKQKIDEIHNALRHGEDFAQLATMYSQDAGSAGKGGDLDWVSEGEMVPEFEAMMKRTPIGNFSTPFATQFGWHIVKVSATRQKDISNERQRQQALMILQSRQAPQIIEEWLEQLKANSYIRVYQ